MLCKMTTMQISEVLGELTHVEARLACPGISVKGDANLLTASPKVAIVGSRLASLAGLANAGTVARAVVGLGGTVVSGLAKGIDTAAHRAGIDEGGRTFAVIGTGLDVAYPRENRGLQSYLASHCAVVSQFPLGTPPRRRNFPQRNRTMALLSDALVIVEASQTSGTVSQGWEALRLGRALFLLESVANDPELFWPAQMREYGAEVLPLDAVSEVLLDLPWVTAGSPGWKSWVLQLGEQ